MLKYRCVRIVLFSLSCVSGHLNAQSWSGIIAPSRAVEWSQAGIPGGIPTRTTICSNLSPGATSAQINAAIQNCPSDQVVFLTAGTYILSAGITFNNKSNVTLRGAGPDQTILTFTGSDSCGGLAADICVVNGTGYNPSGFLPADHTAKWTGGYSQGTTQITLDVVPTGLSVGSVIVLDQANDTTDTGSVFVCDTPNVCRFGSVGNVDGRVIGGKTYSQQQLVQVMAINGDTVTVSPGLYASNWRIQQSPAMWWPDTMITGVGIESMTLDHSNTTGSGPCPGINLPCSGVIFFNASQSWMQNVRSINANRNHLWLYQAWGITIRNSYFYGTIHAGTESYGVEFLTTSNNLVQNNIFQHVTSPIMVGDGEGSVIAHNFSTDDYYGVAAWLPASLNQHNAGPALNLYEGNIGAAVGADSEWGTSNLETVFRNRLTGWEAGKSLNTIPISLQSFHRMYNIIGNVLGTAGYHRKYESSPYTSAADCDRSIYQLGWGFSECSGSSLPSDPLDSTTIFRWGNYDVVNAAVQWNLAEVPSGLGQYANPVPADHNLPSSLYLSAKPSWWGTMPWPAIGPDVNGYSFGNPAQLCYDNTPADALYGSNDVLLFNADACALLAGQYAQVPPPNNLTATATSASQINLGWTASMTSVGLANYLILRCLGVGCTNYVPIATPAGTAFSDSGLTSNTSYSYRLQAMDVSGNRSLYSNPVTVTTQTPPTAPTLTATARSATQINLSWTASTSSVGLANYVVQRCQESGCMNFAQIATPAGTAFSDTGLQFATSYNYRVQAVDTAGNLSPFSNLVSPTTQTPPTTPGSVTATVVGASQINLSWTASTSSVGLADYILQRCLGTGCTNFALIATSTVTTYSDIGLSPSSYSYRVQANDTAGNTSPFSNVASAVIPDVTPPTAPSGLTATASGNQISLSWGASTDDVGVTGYLVERCRGAGCSTFAQITGSTGIIYNDTPLVGNTSYSYRVRATDAAANLSSYSDVASAATAPYITYVQGNYVTPQTAQATVNVKINGAQVSGDLNVVVVGWDDSNAVVSAVTDASGNSYALAVGPTILTGIASQSIYYAKNIAAAAAGANTITVTFSAPAVFPDIRVIEYSGADPANPVDITAASSGNSAFSSSGSATTTNATDLLFGANIVATSTVGPGSSFTSRLLTQPDSDLIEDQMVAATGTYSATAPLNPAGWWIMQMVAVRAASGGATPPTAPGNVTATATSVSQIILNWAASTSSVGLANYLVQRCQGAGCTNFAQIVAPAGTTYSDTGLRPATSYSYRVEAIDTAGNVSPFSSPASATTQTPPTTPSNLTATATSASQINLTWAASSSSMGLANYVVQRCQGAGCTNFAQVSSVPGSATTYSDTALAPGTSYSYRAQAIDTAGNPSPFSNLAIATTQTLVALFSVACNPTTLGPNSASTCTVTLSGASVGWTVVRLAKDNAIVTMPPAVVILDGIATANFTATAGAVPSDQNATLTATLNGVSQSAIISLVAPVLISNLACNPVTLGPGASSNCTVTLTKAAPAAGASVATSSNNAALTVPSSVMIAPGSATGSFNPQASMFSVNQNASVNVSYNGSSQTVNMTMVAPLQVASLVCSPTGLMSGAASTCTVTLSQPTTADTAVSLSSNSGLITLPANVIVPAGSATAGFVASIGTIASDTAGTVTATLAGTSQSAMLTLWATPTLVSLTCSTTTLAVGAGSTCTIKLSKSAGDTPVSVSVSNAALAVPASVIVPQGSSSVSFGVTAQNAIAGWIVVVVKLNGVSRGVVFMISG